MGGDDQVTRARKRRLPEWAATLLTAAAVGASVGVVGAVSQTRPPSTADRAAGKLPGATSNVSGQTPSQAEQAQAAPITPASGEPGYGEWWGPGEGQVFAAEAQFDTPDGKVGLLNTAGPLPTKGHPFFNPIGENGRACVSCHQPANGMSVSVEAIQARWRETGGRDPIFAAVDGANCPSLPPGDPRSHSLLLQRGLFRVFLPWPPKAADGSPLKTEFDLEVVSDPTGCNLDPVYGVKGSNPQVSVFRRPRVVANMKYVTQGGAPFNIKDGSPMSRDPETGRFVNMNIMADAREPTPKTQAVNAALTHLQSKAPPTEAQLQQILAFENQLFMAASWSKDAGDLVEPGGPSGLGPRAMAEHEPGLGDNFYTPVFGYFDQWVPKGEAKTARDAFRASVARGMDVYFTRAFYIRDVTHLNTVGLGNPIKRTCATCHNALMSGMDFAPGWMDLGTGNRPWANLLPTTTELPVFKLTCKPGKEHPFLGRVVYTNDPGRALISGRCVDIGAITMQQFRGLAARAPYFSNGSAKTLRELVDFYDKRFEAGYSEQEKQDLVNFLSVL